MAATSRSLCNYFIPVAFLIHFTSKSITDDQLRFYQYVFIKKKYWIKNNYGYKFFGTQRCPLKICWVQRLPNPTTIGLGNVPRPGQVGLNSVSSLRHWVWRQPDPITIGLDSVLTAKPQARQVQCQPDLVINRLGSVPSLSTLGWCWPDSRDN